MKNCIQETRPTVQTDLPDKARMSIRKLPLLNSCDLFIEITKGPGEGNIYKLTSGTTVIGRKRADLIIEHETVSTKHAVIEALSRDNICIRDLASTNGTFVDGFQVVKKKLRSGSIIKLGKVELIFFYQDLSTPRH